MTIIRFISLVLLTVAAASAWSQSSITVASTTSTEQSGLFAYLIPQFKKASGIDVKVVAVGTGQATDMARRADAVVLFVHDRVAEEKYVADGFAPKRYPVMHHDFMVVGAKSDRAKTKGSDIEKALQAIAGANAHFISRGDKSGTHAAELRYWMQAGVDAAKGNGYKECGCGMGAALNMAATSDAYVLTDRGTWLSFKNWGELVVLVEVDKRLFNQ